MYFVYFHVSFCRAGLYSWERRQDERGRIYYVDHNTRTTTWQKPTQENVRTFQNWQRNEATSLQERSQQHQQRFLLGGGQAGPSGGEAPPMGEPPPIGEPPPLGEPSAPAPRRGPGDDGLGDLDKDWGE